MSKIKELLPVGSVVLLKDATRKVIVIGYAAVENGKKEIWDYIGCAYPIGVVSSDSNLLFNREQIKEVVLSGYSDDEGEEFRRMIEDNLRKLKK